MEPKFYIIKNGMYYRPNRAGYTSAISEAGVYTLEEVALSFPNGDSPNQDGMFFVEKVDEE